jgi:hypothetical protein
LLDGELLFASLAFPNVTRAEKAMLNAVALRTGDAVRPAQRDQELKASVDVGVMLDGLLKCLGLAKLFFYKRDLPRQGR